MVEPSNDLKQKLLELTQKTGYPIMQYNRQRKFGPPPEWVGSPPAKGSEVFVGKLPIDIFEDELVPLFTKVGKIYEFRLMMTLAGFNRGYAFVTYTTRSEAAAAVKLLNGYEIRPGRYIGVVKSVDNCRLFIEGVPKSKTQEQVLEELSKYVGGIVNVILYANCFAFVKFTSNSEAAAARRVLTQDSVKLWDRDVVVDWAEPEPDIDDEQMKKHLEKREYVNAPKKAEGNSSECAGESTCGSTEANTRPLDQKPDYTIAPAKLYAMCKRHMWAPPRYEYTRYTHPSGRDLWTCCVELPHVGLPLVTSPRRIGPLVTSAKETRQQAFTEAAQIALNCINIMHAEQSTILCDATADSHANVPRSTQ